ncbi:MAG: hypothetical protein H6828_12505 [Planctomycetes bacterium]|nr:hypothetical protein [Planctomycetota bacterium]
MARRGRRKLRRGARDAAERAWLEASLRQGGVQLEPFVEVLEECAVHGRVAEDGACRLGPPRRLECDAHGAWRASRALAPGELAPSVADALEREARRVGEALARAGYFGPFGVDAYRYRLDGAEAWQPRSEVNARYTLGWRAPAE